jgi:predicted DNA-binding transcriptional regulator AlpA
MKESNLDEVRLLNRRQVAEAVGRSPDTLDEWVRKGLFPSPMQARAGAPKQWPYRQVVAWIEKRRRARYVPPTRRGRLRQYAEHE